MGCRTYPALACSQPLPRHAVGPHSGYTMLLVWPSTVSTSSNQSRKVKAVRPDALRHGNTVVRSQTAQELLEGLQSAFTAHRDKALRADACGRDDLNSASY